MKFKDLKTAGKDEIYCEWFECAMCGEDGINSSFSFCPDCGEHIEK